MALPKIICIVGPTASGKTALGIALAKKYKGAILSADSRQIYRGMDIGTAKEKGEWRAIGGHEALVVQGITALILLRRMNPIRSLIFRVMPILFLEIY